MTSGVIAREAADFVVDELPRNAVGKVQKNMLRETYKDIYAKAK